MVSCYKSCQWIGLVKYILSAVVCRVCFAEPDTFVASEGCVGVFGEGTRLAMPKTISAPNTSSFKPGSGATEGVLD